MALWLLGDQTERLACKPTAAPTGRTAFTSTADRAPASDDVLWSQNLSRLRADVTMDNVGEDLR